MALSALFLIIFLVVHLLINFLSVINADLFNEASEFMGTNPVIQYLFQPILFIGVIFHFVMGFILEVKNRASRSTEYVMSRPDENSSVFSRYMIYSGATILLFLGLHMVDFFFPSFTAHHITHKHLDSYLMVTEKFQSPVYVVIYIMAFIFLGFHLVHGFQSSFQSIGVRHPKYLPLIQKLGQAYAILVPLGFIFIAVFHYYFN
jgi:succinate dehydrogenase / fumarate reductase cytochrome b subunit